MAGPLQARAACPRQNQDPGIRASSQLVCRSVSINNQKFSTLISDGATAQEVLTKIAVENGGGVAKFYNKELRAYEIVAIKVGDHLLVKNDAGLVSQADFSQFGNPADMKAIALEAAGRSKGGLHFFLGENGIPMAAGRDGEILFPNADELRLSGRSHTIFISVVDYNVNPLSLDDLSSMYQARGGLRISDAARRQLGRPASLDDDEIAKSHGAMRFDKLMLPDAGVLILERDTGEIRSAAELGAEFVSMEAAQDYFSVSQVPASLPAGMPQPWAGIPVFAWIGNLYLDGAAVRPSRLQVRLFDGRIEDELPVRPSQELPTAGPAQQPRVSALDKELVYGGPAAAKSAVSGMADHASLLQPVAQLGKGESRQLTYLIRSKREPVLFRLTAQKPEKLRDARPFLAAPLCGLREPHMLDEPRAVSRPPLRKRDELRPIRADKNTAQPAVRVRGEKINTKPVPYSKKRAAAGPKNKPSPLKRGKCARAAGRKAPRPKPKPGRVKKNASGRNAVLAPIPETLMKRVPGKKLVKRDRLHAPVGKPAKGAPTKKPAARKRNAHKPAESFPARKRKPRHKKKAGLHPYFMNKMLGLTAARKKRARGRRARAGNSG